MSTVAYSKPIPVIAAPDVLVCGAGLAGLGAAVAAARQGASVWAVDRMGFAGGFFTNVIGSAFDGFVFEPTGRPIVNLQDHLMSAGCILDPDIAMHRLGEDP